MGPRPVFAEMNVTATRVLKDLGPENTTNKLVHWVDLLGQLLHRNQVFTF